MSGEPGQVEFPSRARAERYLTSDLPGIGGVLRSRWEDFLVEESPLYEPCGEGEHAYLFVEKHGMSTLEMVGAIAEHFGVRRADIGFAGLKDKRAITRQVVSVHIPGRRVESFPMLRHERLSILWADHHTNKLRRGHLRGNRFSIRVRGVGIADALTAQRVLSRLAVSGVPDRFGPQRFGITGDNHRIGAAMLRGEWSEALALLLGPSPNPTDPLRAMRAAFAEGRYDAAFEACPRVYRAEQRALCALASGADAERAFAAIDSVSREFYVSGFQSAVFNAVLDARLDDGTWNQLTEGDVAMRVTSRDEFLVTAAELAKPDLDARVRSGELSPTGPMWGPAMRVPLGEPGRIEREALEKTGVGATELERFGSSFRGLVEGARRPMRVAVIDPEVESGADGNGPFVRCAFELPRGAFATVVMDEVMKNGAPDAPRSSRQGPPAPEHPDDPEHEGGPRDIGKEA